MGTDTGPGSHPRSARGQTGDHPALASHCLQHRSRRNEARWPDVLMLLFFLGGWVEAWSASGRTSPTMTFVLGPPDRPKRAAWTVIEGAASTGQVTVWESGECDVELYSNEGVKIIHETLLIEAVDDFGSLLRRVLNACD